MGALAQQRKVGQMNGDPHLSPWVTYRCARYSQRSFRLEKNVTRAQPLTSRGLTREHTQCAPFWPCVVRLPWLWQTAQLPLPSSRRANQFLYSA
jgi:hypothetical protein